MGVQELLIEKKAKIESAYQAELNEVDAMINQLAVDLKAAEDKGFDLGLAQAGVPSGDKIYTEADLQAEKQIVRDQMQAEIDAVKAGIPAVVTAEVAALKASIVADLENAAVDNQAVVDKLKA